jgi:hypothetical protein
MTSITRPGHGTLLTSRKGQAWYADFMVGLLIFVSVLAIYYNLQSSFVDDNNNIEDLIADAKQIGASLMTSGYPANWTNSTVQRIGILDGGTRLDNAKLLMFSQMNYNQTRSLFRTSFDYVVYFYDGNRTLVLPNNLTYIGSLPTNATKEFKVVRLPVLNSTIVQMEVHVWQR